MRLALLALGLAACLAGAACDDSSGSCSSPDTTSPTYGCTPHSIEAGGCGAIPYPMTETVDGAYPLGCTATFPACSGFSMLASPVQCICGTVAEAGANGGPAAEWNCPY